MAGVNIASLYQYFPNKDAVLADYFEHEAARIAQRTAELFDAIDRLSRRSLEHTLAAIVTLELEQRRALTVLDPSFFARYPSGADVHGRVEALTRERQNPDWETWLPQFLAQHRSRLRSKNIAVVAALCHGALDGVIAHLPAMPADAAGGDGAKVELLYLLLGYLLARPPSLQDCERYFEELDAVAAETPDAATRPGPTAGDASSR